MTNGFAPSIDQRLRHRDQHFLDLGGDHGLQVVLGNVLVDSGPARSRRQMRAAVAVPRSARISASSISSSVAASSLRLRTRSVSAVPSDAGAALQPAAQALPPASPLSRAVSCGLSGAVIHGRRRDSGLRMTPEEMEARLLYRDGLMLVIDKPAGLPVHRGPKGAATKAAGTEGALQDHFDALRFGLPRAPRTGASARPRNLRLPGARPPPQGAGDARRSVQGRQGRQDLLGRWSKAARRRTKAPSTCRSAGSNETRGWWMKVDPAGQPSADTLEGDGRAAERQ